MNNGLRQITCLWDIPISDLPLEQVYQWVGAKKLSAPMAILMADFELLLRCKWQNATRQACLCAERVFAQDAQVRVAMAMMGHPLENMAFSAKELLLRLMERGGKRFFFLGGLTGMARRAAVALSEEAGCKPCPAVGGAPDGFCRFGCENTAVLTRIWECQPDVVAVCLDDGMEWFCQNRSLLPPALYICVPSALIAVWSGKEGREGNWQRSLRRRCKEKLFYFSVKRRDAVLFS